MSTTLRTGPLPRTGSTRSSPPSSTRAMSEPKMAVAPPAGAVMMVTVFAFMPARFGSVHVSSGLGMPSGRPACGAAVPHIMLIMITGARSRGRNDMAQSPQRRTRAMPHTPGCRNEGKVWRCRGHARFPGVNV